VNISLVPRPENGGTRLGWMWDPLLAWKRIIYLPEKVFKFLALHKERMSCGDLL